MALSDIPIMLPTHMQWHRRASRSSPRMSPTPTPPIIRPRTRRPPTSSGNSRPLHWRWREPVPAISAVQATAAPSSRDTTGRYEIRQCGHRAAHHFGARGRWLRHRSESTSASSPAIDPTQGEPGVLIGNFLAMLAITFFATDMHRLVIAALNDNYSLFEPDEVPAIGDVAALMTKTVSGAFKRHPAFRAVPGVLTPVQSRARRAVAPDAADAGVLRRVAAFDHDRPVVLSAGVRRHDGSVPRLRWRRAARPRTTGVTAA